MNRSGHRIAIAFGIALLSLTATACAWAEEVTIYRCIGKAGKVSLSDAPCAPGEQQQVRAMQRPQDPPPAPTPIAPLAKPTTPEPPREVRVVTVAPPQPMYECIGADGERYTSDSSEGNPRWQPLWVLAPVFNGGGGHPRYPPRSPRPDTPSIPADRSRPPQISVTRPGHGLVPVPAGGTLVRDECHPLPQQEVCARLSDRRYEILRRYHSAMQSEQRQLDLEQRGIDARMANDCAGY